MLLAGCALSPPAEPVAVVDVAPATFAAHGRLSLRQGERRDHLGFDWTHSPERDVVLFLSPLGQGLAEIGRDGAGAWLTRPGEPELRASDLRSLAQQAFGAPLPLDALPDWLRGAHGGSGTADGWRIAITDDIELLILIDGWGEGD
jgi:outer membrane lipoprotein LolB